MSCISLATAPVRNPKLAVQNHVPDTASSPTTEISHHEDGLLRRFSQTTLERHASKAKKRGGSLFGFLSVKEPSTHALEQFAEYQRKQEPTGVKMPVTAPRVSSKWDALPLEQHKVEGFTQHGSHHASTPNGTRRQAHNSNNNTATPRSPSSSSPHALRAPNPALSPTATQSHPAPTSSATPTQQASKSGHLPPTTITSSTTRQKNAPPFLPAAQNLAAIAPWAEPPSPDARPPRPRRTTATDAALPPEVYFPETSEAFLVSGAQAAGLGRGNDGSSALASPSTSTAVAQKLPPASATATACLRAASGPATPTGPGRTSALGRSSSRSTTTGTASTTSTTTKVEMSSTQRPDEKKRKGRFGKLAGKR
ncbi:uncharacterized protein K452DRAFT_304426 [Aplosporella prunicola CBS 121167]|uniref:Uncharacterized protein n=1 Tax=Aplosporella prunicola CBS 121167 TaxID=1176127 RepID=A0A6A6BQQ1_9PEZI|nr:uncharacterized protein K452DRAFT_304426 [Aplosporella prunicola CBS 121167]KAF2146452.1 hypothetical protein K452DRAFT_304426 [Aplosporella prunicola CBS 121167]